MAATWLDFMVKAGSSHLTNVWEKDGILKSRVSWQHATTGQKVKMFPTGYHRYLYTSSATKPQFNFEDFREGNTYECHEP